MTKYECRMSKEDFPGPCRGIRRGERMMNCVGAWHMRRHNGFTLIELVLVVGIIAVLAGLVLSTVGYARKKGARARAETEIAALSAAIENYKADNAIYVRGPATAMTIGSITIPANVTDTLDPKANGDPNSAVYGQTSLYLYTQLSGDSIGNQQATGKGYFSFKPQMLSTDSSGFVTAIKDPFGSSYGYLVQRTRLMRRKATTQLSIFGARSA